MNKDKLIEILSIQSASYNQDRMIKYVKKQLRSMGIKYTTDSAGNIYATKGKASSYPCIVSHLDTVHRITDDLYPLELNGNITGFNRKTMTQTGIGGDDKVGIFIALSCLETFTNIKSVFFTDEETGCEGSYDCDISFFNNCNFILQADRKGNCDFITEAGGVKLSEEDFQNDISVILKNYGYKLESGMMTDVMALKEIGIQCAMANISCGYYNPHSSNEYVNIRDVQTCLEMIKDIVYAIGSTYYHCDYVSYEEKFKFNDYRASYNYWKDEKWDFSNKKETKTYCDCCNERKSVRHIAMYNMDMCQRCIDEFIEYDVA